MGIFDTLLGNTAADTSNAAAADTYAKQQDAIKGIKKYGNQYAASFRDLSTAYAPYAQSGNAALQRLMAGLGLGTPEDQAAFVNSYRSLPGYEAGLESGTRAVTRGANAGNMLNSGNTLRALQRFGSDYEDQRVGDYMTRLGGIGQMGLAGTQGQVNTTGQGLQGQMTARQSAFQGGMNSAGTVGQGMVAGAQAQQNALQNLLGIGGYLGGAVLGGPIGGSWAKSMFGGSAAPQQGWYQGSPSGFPLA